MALSKITREFAVTEISPDQLYFCTVEYRTNSTNSIWYYYPDKDVHYDGFYKDFGPYNLSVLYRFCNKLNTQLKKSNGKRKIVICCSKMDQALVNTAYLVGSYAIIYLGMSADTAYTRLSGAVSNGFIGFIDAAMGAPTYKLHLHDVLRSVQKALHFKWLSFESFDPDEYEFYEKVENGDLNWIIPGKILSFCGPQNEAYCIDGYPYHSPEHYFDYFRRNGITTIIRLNKRMYDARKFIKAGFDHIDLFFVDGTTPSDAIVERFINSVDAASGGVAVHCKAGLGRTGTLIACWLMKEFELTAAESMAWIRICRPGSVLGPQQQFLIEKQPWCWALKSKRKDTSPSSNLASKVHEIHIRDIEHPISRPNCFPVKDNSKLGICTVDDNEENALDETGRTQGDRLLARKAIAQRHISFAVFTSPTTPIKPMNASGRTKKSSYLRRGLRCSVQPPPISRVIVSSVYPTLIKSNNSRKHTGIRCAPYPSAGIKIHLPPCAYDLRSRHKFNVIQVPNSSKTLPPNTAALLGVLRDQK